MLSRPTRPRMSTRNGLLFRMISAAALLLVFVLYLASTTLTFGSRTYAQNQGTLPVASLVSVSPNPVREGTRLRVTVRLIPESGSETHPVRGGIRVFDSGNGPQVDELIAWAFRGRGNTETDLTHLVCYDGVTTSNRTIQIALHPGNWEDCQSPGPMGQSSPGSLSHPVGL